MNPSSSLHSPHSPAAARTGLAALACCALLALLTGLLAGCGGSASEPAAAAAAPVQCDFGLRYANGVSSGIAINPEARTVPRQFTPCSLTQVQSATLGICLQHPDLSELDAQLIQPDGTALALNLQAATRTGAACLDSGTLLSMSLPTTALPRLLNPQGQWSLMLTDLKPGYGSGSLVGWSLDLRGLP
jgi:hypothetical protein